MGTRYAYGTAVLVVAMSLLRPRAGSASPSDERAERLWRKQAGHRPQRIHHQPRGPFAAFLFCEDALGTYLAVMYLEPLGAPTAQPFAGTWELDNRVWQDGLWAADVTSFAWSPDGRRLYATTSEIYGSGGLFELDLLSRKARQIAPDTPVSKSASGADYVITSIDEKAGVLHYSPGDGKVSFGRP